jgi:hypothetical protein
METRVKGKSVDLPNTSSGEPWPCILSSPVIRCEGPRAKIKSPNEPILVPKFVLAPQLLTPKGLRSTPKNEPILLNSKGFRFLFSAPPRGTSALARFLAIPSYYRGVSGTANRGLRTTVFPACRVPRTAFATILRDCQRCGVINNVGRCAMNTAPHEQRNRNMKTRNLLMTLTVAALAATNVHAAETLLSPKASAPVKAVSGYNSDPNLAATGLQSAPPRVVESKTKTVAGKSLEVTPSMICSRKMLGSPKMIGACADHQVDSTMSCCAPAPGK